MTRSRIRILIVDDEKELGQSLCGLFSSLGFSCSHYSQPKQALKILENESFDFIITDVIMPEMDGLQFLDKLREISTPNGRLFVVSANSEYPEDEFTSRGVTGFFRKPDDIRKLIEIIASSSQNDTDH